AAPAAAHAAPASLPPPAALPLSRSRRLAPPAIQRAPSAPPHRPAAGGKTLRALPGLLPNAPALQSCGRAEARVIARSLPADAPGPLRLRSPASCDPAPDDGSTATAASAAPPHPRRGTHALAAPAA